MVHVRVSEVYINFALMYMTDSIFLVLPIKDLIKEDGELTTSFKLTTVKKPPVSHLCVLFCLCVVRKATAHVDTKSLNMRHQWKEVFCGIFVGIPQHQKGYLVYVPHTRKILYSYDVVFYEIFLVSWHKHHNHMKKQCLHNRLCHIHIMLHHQGKKTGAIITFTQFEEGNI